MFVVKVLDCRISQRKVIGVEREDVDPKETGKWGTMNMSRSSLICIAEFTVSAAGFHLTALQLIRFQEWEEWISVSRRSSPLLSPVPALHPSQDMPCTSGMQVLYLLTCSIECCLQKGSWLQLIVCEVVWPLKSQCSINSAEIV